MLLYICIFFPVIAGIYGGLVGGYIHSQNKSLKRRVALWTGGLILFVLYAVSLFKLLAR